MSEPPVQVLRHLEFHLPRMWKGELEFTSRQAREPVATLLITQVVSADVLRLDWNGETVAALERSSFYAWLRAGELGRAAELAPFTADRVTWQWKDPDLHVTIAGIEHVFPVTALYTLRVLAVR